TTSSTLSGVIGGSGSFTKSGAGTLILTGTNTYTGGTNLNGGTLAVSSDANLGTGALSFNGGTMEALAAGGGITSNKAVTLNAGGGTFLADATTSSTLSGVIGGSGSFTKSGAGTLILTGTNTYTGGTNLNGGTLAVNSDANLGTGVLSFNGGTLEALAAGGGIASNKAVTLNAGGGTFLADTGTNSTLSGIISGSGSFTKNGAGTLNLTGANTYSGGTNLNGGTLGVDSDGNLGTGALTFNGGTLEALAAGGGITSSKSIILNAAGGTFLADGGTSSILSGSISGSGPFIKSGSGTLTLTSANITYTGDIELNGGILAVDNDFNLGVGALSFNGGTLEALAAGGGITSNKAVTLNALGGTFLADATTSSTLSGVIGGAGSFTMSGSGTLALTATNTYSGGTNLNGGTLAVNSDANLGTGALSFNGGTLEALAGITSNKAITLNAGGGTFLADAGTSSTLSGAISGAGSFTKNGTGTLTLSGNNTYSGATTVAAGTLQAGSLTGLSASSAFTVNSVLDLNGFSNTIGSLAGTGTVLNNGVSTASLTVGADNTTTTFSGAIENGTSALQLVKTGTGTLILTGSNTYTGGTTINGTGTLQIGNLTQTGSITGNITDNAHLTFDRSNTFVFGGSISGTGTVTQNGGTGTLVLSGNNTYSGATTVNAGTLQAGSTTAFSANSAYTVSSVLDLNGFSNSIGSLAGTGTVLSNGPPTATLTVGADNTSTTFSGLIQNGLGLLALTKIGGGTLTLTSAVNAYSGGTNLNGGTLAVNSDSNLGTGALSFNGGTLEALTAGGGITSSKAITLNGLGGTFLADAGTSSTLSGAISGAGSFTLDGPGTLTLSGNNTYNGATTINTGTLRAGSLTGLSQNSAFTVNSVLDLNGFSSTIGSLAGAGTIRNSGGTTATLSVGHDNSNTTFDGALGDGASPLALNKVGTGTLILVGANTYTGGTTITAGTLQIGNGTLGAGSIAGNVTDNGVLAFDRPDTVTFPGVITGAGSLTQSGTGVLILTGTNTYIGGTTISNGTLQIGNGATGGSIVGNVADSGLLTFDEPGNAIFAGTISGSGSLIQNGTGTLILTADNTFTGTTTISLGSTVQLGNGGPTGSVAGNIVDDGTLSFNRSGTLNYSGVISGTGSLQQDGPGTTILSGTNTYSGGTVVNAGTLTVNNAQALGVGNVVVNGGILRADPQPINVKGNYTQNAGGTLQLQVAGASSGQYDYLNVGGNASLAGTLQLLSLGYQPKAGDQLTLVSAGGMISGRFGTFLDPFSKGPGFNTVDLIYAKNSVELEFLNMSIPVTSPIPPPIQPPTAPPVIVTINFASFGLTPNQRAAGNLLDKIELDPAAHALIAFLGKESVFNLAGDLEKISPDALTAFYEIGFSNSNIQRLNLDGRLDDLRSGSTGFNSNMNIKG
ncbi:MAG: autotransporter-associated beta strand repeat-containing protein, partial [Verrucomicrobia bacterium]|nr:autotransporter-associated beta strand repeat-containing protein [Verrucomicrobiota bacterium]